MTQDPTFQAKIWGARGSIPCPGQAYAHYGGNTSCVEMICGGKRLIFDAGSGLRALGQSLINGGDPLAAEGGHLFLTHTHYDHVIGLPFFKPLFDKGHRWHLWAGHLIPESDLAAVLHKFMAAPLFPVPPKIFSCALTFEDFEAGATLELDSDIVIRTAPLNHPNRATGYRVDYAGKSICYVTDTEHRKDGPDRNVLGLIEGADIVIYDANYTDEEYVKYAGWGHSTWQEGVRLCELAKAGRLVLFHHDPARKDGVLKAIEREAAAARPGTVAAREGLVLTP